MGQSSSSSSGHVLGGEATHPQQQHKQREPRSQPVNSDHTPIQSSRSQQPANLSKSANSESDREARLAAIEARNKVAEKRGVQKTGGKLAQKLEDSKKSPGVGNGGFSHEDEAADLWKSG